jgi:GNAT superfamily N-acetyltransferase
MDGLLTSLAALPANQAAAHTTSALALITSVWPRWLLSAGAPEPDSPPTDWSVLFTRWPHLQLLLLGDDGELLGVANSVPLSWSAPASTLPEEGWDWAYSSALSDADAGRLPQTLCALAVTLSPSAQGRGLSRVMLGGLKDAARAAGLSRLIVPVRPNRKSQHPWLSMGDYLLRLRPDGLPLDPWLRTHVRLDAQVIGACTRSMRLSGRIADWEEWLGQPLTAAQQQVAPTLLVPLSVDHESGIARYTEPNVWVEYPLH